MYLYYSTSFIALAVRPCPKSIRLGRERFRARGDRLINTAKVIDVPIEWVYQYIPIGQVSRFKGARILE